MRLSQNLFQKSSFNSTIVRLAQICQLEFPDNYSLVMSEVWRHEVGKKMLTTVCLDRHRQQAYPRVNKNIFKEIQKYYAF